MVLREIEGDNPIRVSMHQGSPLDGKMNKTAFRAARARAGLPKPRWHDLRNTRASWHVLRGTPLEFLEELGGWADLTMVMRYAHLRQAYSQIHKIIAETSGNPPPERSRSPTHRTEEVNSSHTMIDRVEHRFHLKPIE